MNLTEAEALVPKSFIIACHTITIKIEEKGDSFGEYDSLRNTITLFLEVSEDDGRHYVAQSKEQFLNTYWHEVYHVFNFFWNTEMDESLAQSFANFTCEYLNTKTN